MKAAMRKKIRQVLMELTPQAEAAKSRAACRALTMSDEFCLARSVMIYLSTPGEVDTTEIALAAWQHSKVVLAPQVSWEHKHMVPLEIRGLDSGLTVGRNNIREPAGGTPWPLEDIDLVVVPALAFDRRGFRLGRGGGFYDRFLAQPTLRAVACGLAFSEQVVDAVPTHEHDRPVHMLASDEGVLRFNHASRRQFAVE